METLSGVYTKQLGLLSLLLQTFGDTHNLVLLPFGNSGCIYAYILSGKFERHLILVV